MRWITYQSERGARVAGARDGGYVDVHDADRTLPASLKEPPALGGPGMHRGTVAVAHGPLLPTGLKRLAPIPDPQKVICIGLNYADHARESGMAPPSEPVV